MTLPDVISTLLGDGSIHSDPKVSDVAADDLALLRAADARAEALQRVSGVFFIEPDNLEAAKRYTAAIVDGLARDYSEGLDLDAVDAAVIAAGKVPFGDGQEALSRLVRRYLRFQQRASFHLGLCVGWRTAQTLGRRTMTAQAMLDAFNLADMVLEYAEAELARVWFTAIPRRLVASLRIGIRHAKKDIAHLLDASPGGTR